MILGQIIQEHLNGHLWLDLSDSLDNRLKRDDRCGPSCTAVFSYYERSVDIVEAGRIDIIVALDAGSEIADSCFNRLI
jgi:hypothetical protein